MSLDKQLIHVFSSPSTWKKSLFLQVRWIPPPPTLKRTKKKKKPRHFQTKKPFTDKCHFPVLICACLFFFPFFTKRSQCGRLTEKCVCANGLWGGGRCCGGGWAAAATINSLLCFSKSLHIWKGKKRSYCKMTCHLASLGTSAY